MLMIQRMMMKKMKSKTRIKVNATKTITLVDKLSTSESKNYSLKEKLIYWLKNIPKNQHQCRSFCACCKWYGECSYDFSK